MRTKSYKYNQKKNVFVIVESSHDLAAVPTEIQKQFGGLTFFKEFDLELNDPPRIALDTKAAIADIQKQGYHIQVTEIGFTKK